MKLVVTVGSFTVFSSFSVGSLASNVQVSNTTVHPKAVMRLVDAKTSETNEQ